MMECSENPEVDTESTGVRPPADPAAAKAWSDRELARRRVLAASINFSLDPPTGLSPAGYRAEVEKTHTAINDALDVWQAADLRYRKHISRMARS